MPGQLVLQLLIDYLLLFYRQQESATLLFLCLLGHKCKFTAQIKSVYPFRTVIAKILLRDCGR